MKKILISILAAKHLMVVSTAEAYGFTGNDLYESCKVFVSGDTPENIIDAINLGGCASAVSTVMFLRENLRMCIPKEVSLLQGVKLTLKFMNSHPEVLHMHLSAIAYWSLNEAFPCQNK